MTAAERLFESPPVTEAVMIECRYCGHSYPESAFGIQNGRRRLRCRVCRTAAAKHAYHTEPHRRAQQLAHSLNATARKRGWTGPYIAPPLLIDLILNGKACHYCGLPNTESGRGFAADHYVPYKLGGEHRMENIVLACEPCNRAKHDQPPEEYIRWLDAAAERIVARRAT